MNFWQDNKGNAQYQAIAASAGSGKTYKLTHRIIGLLACGVPPDRIVGLTFSRKSAGEILDDTLKYLCEAAGDDNLARSHAENACRPGTTRAEFLQILRRVVGALPRLRLQTLDSFSVAMLRAFQIELGLPGAMDIIDDNAALVKRLQDRLLRRLLLDENRDPLLAGGFLHDFKEATAGREAKSVRAAISEFISIYHGLWLRFPETAAWGVASRIWPAGLPFRTIGNFEAEAEELVARMPQAEDFGKAMVKFLEAIRNTRPGISQKYGVLGDRLFPKVRELLSGQPVEFNFGRGKKPHVVEGETARRLGALLGHVLAADLQTALERTGGIQRLVRRFEETYDREIRRQGRLSFADLQVILDPEYGGTERAIAYENACFRLDGCFEHWLLDEFQDTSDSQWRVLERLIAEVITSPERSLFYVGDVKQAIYQWREGNPRLFDQLRNAYSNIHTFGLTTCRRQSHGVIDTVNRVFGGGVPLAAVAGHLPGLALQRWREAWREHQARPDAPPGYCALIQLRPDKEPVEEEASEAAAADPRLEATASLLNRLEPLARGLTAAVLVRGNAFGKKMADHLRAACPDMEVVLEGDAKVNDSTAVAALLALFRAAAHPGDTLAWKHLEMSPLATVIREQGLDRHGLPAAVAAQAGEEGFQKTVRRWGLMLLGKLYPGAAAFDRRRLEDLCDAAAAYDSGGDADPGRFVAFAEAYSRRENSRDNAVRVMTFHQAKGLGFDIVILPELRGKNGIQKLAGDSVPAITNNDPRWVLKRPLPQARAVCPEIDTAWSRMDADHCFEALCILYVGMTRAKQAMYMLVPPPPKEVDAIHHATVLRNTLGADATPRPAPGIPGAELLYETGLSDWFTSAAVKSAATAEPPAALPPEFIAGAAAGAGKMRRLSPAAAAEGRVPARLFFSPARTEALAVGNAVHEFMQRLDWLETDAVPALPAGWLAGRHLSRQAQAEVERQLTVSLGSPAVRGVFTRPTGDATDFWLWRERPFEAMLPGAGWVSGVFDRVVILRSPRGTPIGATITDFKTDRVADAATLEARVRGHQPQLELYRRVLARILGLEERLIRLQLVFTTRGILQAVE